VVQSGSVTSNACIAIFFCASNGKNYIDAAVFLLDFALFSKRPCLPSL